MHAYFGAAPGLAPELIPKNTATSETIAAQRRVVGEAAGRAIMAPRITNLLWSVQGSDQRIDPVANWEAPFSPKPVLTSGNILDSCSQMIGRLDALAMDAEARQPDALDPAQLHPTVWGAAARYWRHEAYQAAVKAACDALVANLKSITGRNDVQETDLWRQAFSGNPPEFGKPRLRWPGKSDDLDVKSMNGGLVQFAPGASMLIRNPAAHPAAELSPQEAVERLATLSLLARWVEQCELVSVDPVAGDNTAERADG